MFELHIRPLFRLLDRTHMRSLVTPGIDLWDLDTVWAAREAILTRLRGEGGLNMPGVPVDPRVGDPGPEPSRAEHRQRRQHHDHEPPHGVMVGRGALR